MVGLRSRKEDTTPAPKSLDSVRSSGSSRKTPSLSTPAGKQKRATPALTPLQIVIWVSFGVVVFVVLLKATAPPVHQRHHSIRSVAGHTIFKDGPAKQAEKVGKKGQVLHHAITSVKKEDLHGLAGGQEENGEEHELPMTYEEAIHGRERLVGILNDAGVEELDTETVLSLPTWKSVTKLYGEEPVIIGLETCERFRNTIPLDDASIGTAGMFNTGTNPFAMYIEDNCIMPFNTHDSHGGTRWQVPWGKHTLASRKWTNTAGHDGKVNKTNVLPVAIVRDPYSWMQSMCKHPYDARWPRSAEHCPNLVPTEEEKATATDPSIYANGTVPVTIKYKPPAHFPTIAHYWTEWYKEYLEADYPRLIVRFEDLQFHAKEMISAVCECAGAVPRDPGGEFTYVVDAGKWGAGHKGEQTNLITAMIKYGTDAKRFDKMTKEDMKLAATALDPELMKLLDTKTLCVIYYSALGMHKDIGEGFGSEGVWEKPKTSGPKRGKVVLPVLVGILMVCGVYGAWGFSAFPETSTVETTTKSDTETSKTSLSALNSRSNNTGEGSSSTNVDKYSFFHSGRASQTQKKDKKGNFLMQSFSSVSKEDLGSLADHIPDHVHNMSFEEALQGREPIVDILYDAGIESLDTATLSSLPKWSSVTKLYGDEPVVLGLETCSRFRETVSATEASIGPAGLFNTGTNALLHYLENNCYMPQNHVTKEKGVLWQVPWGKHTPPDRKWTNTPKYGIPFNKSAVLPVVMVRDPYTWMQSLCKHPYATKWQYKTGHCPNLVPNMDDVKAVNGTVPVTVMYKPPEHYDSLAHYWKQWLEGYLNADYPRLIVRFEDMQFHAKEVMSAICECAGAVPRHPDAQFSYVVDSGKWGAGHKGEQTNMITAMIKYGTDTKRLYQMTKDDVLKTNEVVGEDLMNMFHYEIPRMP
eukprot:Nitzschia sp. Nitz4//scaffold37_size175936//13709//17211//NITZ4_002025-RA/size175936-snap-gene-0.253-mRNA-1//-1//CDS//3329549725//8229//frame0